MEIIKWKVTKNKYGEWVASFRGEVEPGRKITRLKPKRTWIDAYSFAEGESRVIWRKKNQNNY